MSLKTLKQPETKRPTKMKD